METKFEREIAAAMQTRKDTLFKNYPDNLIFISQYQ